MRWSERWLTLKRVAPFWALSLLAVHFLWSCWTALDLTLTGGVRTAASDQILRMDVRLQTFLLVLGLMVLIFRRFYWPQAVVAYVVAWYLPETFFTGPVHDFFEWLGVYPDFLRESSKSSVNKNFAKVSVLFFVGLGLLLRCVRRPRSMERIYFALIFWSVLITSSLFHWVTKKGIEDARAAGVPALMLASHAPSSLYKTICFELKFQCLELDFGAKQDYSELGDVKAAFITGLQSDALVRDARILSGSSFAIHSNDRKSVYSAVVSKRHDGSIRVVFDNELYRGSLYLWQYLYAVLALAAHSLWVIGGGWLLYWHKRRMLAKSRAAALRCPEE